MNVGELKALLAQYPDDMPIRINSNYEPAVAFTDDHIALTSDTAYANDEVPEEEWDNAFGKIELGNGQRYLMLNAPIL